MGPDALLDCLARLEQPSPTSRALVQRQFQRFTARGEVELTSMDRRTEDPTLNVQLRDLSRGGLGLLSEKAIEVGSTWRVAFLSNGFVVGTQGVIVRHCHMVQPGVYLVGTQFCIETGLMCLLGIDPNAIHDGDDANESQKHKFLAPGEVA